MEAGVKKITTGDDWRRMMEAASQFPNYSFLNTLLILQQRPDATRVASYSTWQRLGRELKPKAERGNPIIIRRPQTRSVRSHTPEVEETDQEAAPEAPQPAPRSAQGRARSVVIPGKFAPMKAWDISQTSGPDIPTITAKVLEGDAPKHLWDAMVKEAERLGYLVRFGTTLGGGRAQGHTDPDQRDVVINDNLFTKPMAALKTLTHEVGHVLFGDVDDIAEYRQHRGLAEVRVESFAYVVLAHIGLDTSDYSFPYVASWSGGDHKLVEKVGGQAVQTAHDLLRRVPTLTLDPVTEIEEQEQGVDVADSTIAPALVAEAAPAPAPTPRAELGGDMLF